MKKKSIQAPTLLKNDDGYWAMTESVFYCLFDHKRTKAFKAAIENTIKKGDVVVDMGTGSGVLAMFAVEAGAERVYAIELDKNNIQTLRRTIEINGYREKIIILEGDVTKMELPEKVNVVIGEMIATGLVEELQVPAMNNILKYAKKDVRVVLKEYESSIDLVHNRDSLYGHKFKMVRYEIPGIAGSKSISFSEMIPYSRVDFSVFTRKKNIDKKVRFMIHKNGIINGIRISGKTFFEDGSSFDYSVAYSFPIILPIDDIHVKKGDEFIVSISYTLCGGFKTLKYSIKK